MSRTSDAGATGKPNRLAREKSPYLLQHAFNPVDWFPWGDEAFARARQLQRPIFLSIGYSTCHWCHVMERESFEDPGIAEILNRHYVAIKVDREERPDVDRVYMTAVQALTGSGGWPLSAWLTPELEPFYAGTYFPPAPRGGMPGFADLLLQLHRAWEENHDRVLESAASIAEALRSISNPQGTEELDLERAAQTAYAQFHRSFDPRFGGFGGAPKFPRPSALGFLFHHGLRHPDSSAHQLALDTLKGMWRGGMNDHLGGGFHRYSVDAEWRVPHFEKMLYDQAQLVWAFLDAYQITSDAFYGDAARDVLQYVERELTSPDGGFYSAEDADSAVDADRPEEKQEGAYYLWEKEEIEAALDPPESAAVLLVYGISASGNTLHDPHGELGTRNVLYQAHPPSEAAASLEITRQELEARLESAKEKLLALRGRRPRPHLDDKILTGWNGLMISAFARAAQVLEEPSFAESARRAAAFVLANNLVDGELRRRYRDGEARHRAHLDDHAFLANGLIDLYEATFEPAWLERATELAETMLERFSDPQDEALYDVAAGDPSILVRTKEGYDGAEPAGNSMAALVLLRLGVMLDRQDWLEKARAIPRAFSRRLQDEPLALPQLLLVARLAASPPQQVVLAGDPEGELGRELLARVRRRYQPGRVLLALDTPGSRALLEPLVPHLAGMEAAKEGATVFLCEGFVCREPTSDPAVLAERLDRVAPDRVSPDRV